MTRYTIKDLEHLSGIKAHTIRIWEKRYKLINPGRTESNIRYYSDEDLKKLMNVSFLNNHGVKISKIVTKSNEEIATQIEGLSRVHQDSSMHIEKLVVAMIDLDEFMFDKIINSSILKDGFEQTVVNLIYPFLEKVGILWQTGSVNPAHEHFISNLIRQKLITAIEGVIPEKLENPKQFFLFLPEGEYHELGLLFYYYVLKKMGHHVFYLGQSAPLSDVKAVTEFKHPDYILVSFISTCNGLDIPSFVKNLHDEFRNSKIVLVGALIQQLTQHLPAEALVVKDIETLRTYLAR